jgi:PHD/YefM family antitoxin component YafN of YafNO toxin-antitoxin module
MNTIPAREIKRRGITAVDKALEEGPVHVIKNDRLAYVVLTEDFYRELTNGYEEASLARIRESMEDVKAGRVRKMTADEIIAELSLRD